MNEALRRKIENAERDTKNFSRGIEWRWQEELLADYEKNPSEDLERFFEKRRRRNKLIYGR